MCKVVAHDESATHEGKDEARRDAADEEFKGAHIALSNALRAPGAVMVQLLAAVVAVAAVLHVDILACDHLANVAKL